MQIHVRVAGLMLGEAITEAFDEEVPGGGLTLGQVLDALDKNRKMGKKFFKRLLKSERPPTILLNGMRIDLPEGLETKVDEGAELSIVSPIAGGK